MRLKQRIRQAKHIPEAISGAGNPMSSMSLRMVCFATPVMQTICVDAVALDESSYNKSMLFCGQTVHGNQE